MILKYSLVRKAVLIPIIWIKKIDQTALSNEERFGRTKKKKNIVKKEYQNEPNL